MAEEKPKKKRFEGLIQFKDALRQTVVCLQAAMDARLSTVAQSELVKNLDQESEGAHHLLFTVGDHLPTAVVQADELKDHHLVTRIYQMQGEDLRSEVLWHGSDTPHISFWLDSSDVLMANFFFWLISVACKSQEAFDVTHCMHWGGTVERAAVQSVKFAPQQISEWIKRYHLSSDRAQAMQGFLNAVTPYLHELDGLQLVSDGSYIGLVIDGTAKPLDQKAMNQMISQLTACEAHSIVVNLGNSEQEKSQFLLLLPIRIPNKSINVSPLKGFVILKKMSRIASDHASDPTQQSA